VSHTGKSESIAKLWHALKFPRHCYAEELVQHFMCVCVCVCVCTVNSGIAPPSAPIKICEQKFRIILYFDLLPETAVNRVVDCVYTTCVE
jgi:hypothetical protein